MSKPPTAAGHMLRSVIVGSAVGMMTLTVIGAVQNSIDRYMNSWLFMLIQFAITLTATVYAGHWFLLQYRKRGYWPVDRLTPSDIPLEDADPLLKHVIAQTWNTNTSMVGWYDDDGKMHFKEAPIPRVPMVLRHADGTTQDVIGEACLMVDDGIAAVKLKAVYDLDGKPVPIPPGGVLEGSVPGQWMTGGGPDAP